MQNLEFIQIFKVNQTLYQNLLPKWINYMNEVTEDKSNDEIIRDFNRRINIQGTRIDMHFELCYLGTELIGFSNFAIDTGTLYGLLQAGYGTIMEFYVVPSYRRKGYGTILYSHLEETLKNDSAEHIYLTPDLVTGKPFWVAMGFCDTGIIDPDNDLIVYLRNCRTARYKHNTNHSRRVAPVGEWFVYVLYYGMKNQEAGRRSCLLPVFFGI